MMVGHDLYLYVPGIEQVLFHVKAARSKIVFCFPGGFNGSLLQIVLPGGRFSCPFRRPLLKA